MDEQTVYLRQILRGGTRVPEALVMLELRYPKLGMRGALMTLRKLREEGKDNG